MCPCYAELLKNKINHMSNCDHRTAAAAVLPVSPTVVVGGGGASQRFQLGHDAQHQLLLPGPTHHLDTQREANGIPVGKRKLSVPSV